MRMKQRILLVIVLNLVIVLVELGAGIAAQSMGLVADALHNLSDVAALGVAWLAVRFSERKASRSMTWGYTRSEMMAGFFNSLVLVAAMGIVVIESVRRLFHPVEVEGGIMIVVAGVAMLMNILSVVLLRGVHVHQGSLHVHETPQHEAAVPEEKGNLNIRAAVLHLISDVGISAAVVLGGVLVSLGGWSWLDPALSLGFSVFIIFEAVRILRVAFSSLMDASRLPPGLLEEILTAVQGVPGVHSLHDVHFTQPSSHDRHFSAHLVLEGDPGLQQIDILLEEVRQVLGKWEITHIVLQPEGRGYHREDILCCGHTQHE